MNKFLPKLVYPLFFLLPLYLFKIPLKIGGSINGLDLLLLFFLLTFVVYLFLSRNWQDFSIFLREKRQIAFALGIILFSCVLSLLSQPGGTILDGLGIFKSYLILPIACAFCIAYLTGRQIINVNRIYLSYFFYASVLGAGGLFFLLQEKLTYDNRLQLFFNSPNYLAIALAPGILIGANFLRQNQISSRFRLVVFFSLLLQILSFLFTFSAGAWIGIIVGLLLVYQPSLNFNFRKTIVSVSVVVLMLLFNINFLASLFHFSPSVPPTSSDSRLAIYQSAEIILKNNWFFGIGPGNFQKKYLENQRYFTPYPQWAVPHAHNLFLYFWIELGMGAFLGLLYLLWPRSTVKETKLLLASTIIIYFLVHGLVDATIGKNDLAFVFWTFLLIEKIKKAT